ncbi:ribokinase [Paenibacillus soyae]|uniref:Ribokinase n=1 Tax=Paenibacillus soyae TaxID=2969249 RepID=A0A9X2MP19_9BACL|nr:ribokinase [Paenibacillus soyae]MCR2803830.1 ribokinase [Paenibacillus soyae]
MTKPRIAVVGSLNMDIVVSMPRLPRLGETIGGNEVHYVPGGKGANQALACSRLTAETILIGCVGADLFGSTIREQMVRNGVSLEAIEMLEGTSTGTAHISHTPEDNCIVVVSGANGLCTADLVQRQARLLQEQQIVLAQLEIPMESVAAAFEIAKAAGASTILNPAPASALPEQLLGLTDYLTPNESEWTLLYGSEPRSEEELERSLQDWSSRYGCTVIVTRGESGSSFLVDGRLQTVPASRVNVVDTTGAGDCFNAALAYGLATGRSLGEAVQLAVKAASLSVQTFGAQDGMPTLAEVEAFQA